MDKYTSSIQKERRSAKINESRGIVKKEDQTNDPRNSFGGPSYMKTLEMRKMREEMRKRQEELQRQEEELQRRQAQSQRKYFNFLGLSQTPLSQIIRERKLKEELHKEKLQKQREEELERKEKRQDELERQKIIRNSKNHAIEKWEEFKKSGISPLFFDIRNVAINFFKQNRPNDNNIPVFEFEEQDKERLKILDGMSSARGRFQGGPPPFSRNSPLPPSTGTLPQPPSRGTSPPPPNQGDRKSVV